MAEPDEGHVIDELCRQFAECRELGIAVPEAMPLDTPEHRRAAVFWLSRRIQRRRMNGDSDG